MQTYLKHHGTKGQHWGHRRYQNHDGSLTALGREHYGIGKKREDGSLNAVERFRYLKRDGTLKDAGHRKVKTLQDEYNRLSVKDHVSTEYGEKRKAKIADKYEKLTGAKIKYSDRAYKAQLKKEAEAREAEEADRRVKDEERQKRRAEIEKSNRLLDENPNNMTLEDLQYAKARYDALRDLERSKQDYDGLTSSKTVEKVKTMLIDTAVDSAKNYLSAASKKVIENAMKEIDPYDSVKRETEKLTAKANKLKAENELTWQQYTQDEYKKGNYNPEKKNLNKEESDYDIALKRYENNQKILDARKKYQESKNDYAYAKKVAEEYESGNYSFVSKPRTGGKDDNNSKSEKSNNQTNNPQPQAQQPKQSKPEQKQTSAQTSTSKPSTTQVLDKYKGEGYSFKMKPKSEPKEEPKTTAERVSEVKEHARELAQEKGKAAVSSYLSSTVNSYEGKNTMGDGSISTKAIESAIEDILKDL